MKPYNVKRISNFPFWFTAALIVISFTAQSQTQRESSLLKEVTHHSPNVSTLGKFGEVPVGNFTGVPNITVPLYEAISGPLKLPISLDYHAGGVKVEEVASNVGLSWVLQAGGVISRSVRGLPDYGGDWVNVEEQMPVPTDTYLEQVDVGDSDAEADIFNFSFNGRNGKFFVGKNGVVHTIPKANILITRHGTEWTAGWKIVDETGTQYFFGKSEMTHTPDASTETSWVLTEIISNDGKHAITFTYETGYIVYQVLVGQTTHISTSLNGNGCGGSSGGTPEQHINVGTQRLTRIDFESGHIQFNYFHERCDVLADKVLDEVVIYSTNDTFYKKFVLSHSYFGKHSTCDQSQALLKRLKLESIMEVTASESKPPYIFTYDESFVFPSRLSFAQDHWGYFNGVDNTTLIPGGIPGPLYNYNGADRSVNPAKAQIGILKSIQYPTGGVTNFTYESNTVGYNPLAEPSFEVKTLQYIFAEPNYPIVDMETPLNVTPLVIPEGGATVIEYIITGLDAAPWPDCDVSGVYLTRNGIPQGEKLRSSIGPAGPFYRQLEEGIYGLTIIHDCSSQVLMPHFSVIFRVKVPVNTTSIPQVGGLRIKEIEDVPADGGPSIKREFKYNKESDLNSSSGGLINFPLYTSNVSVVFTSFVGPGRVAYCDYLVATSLSQVPLATTSGSYVGYSFVTEVFSNGAENRYSYLNFQGSLYPQLPFAPLNLHEWRRGFLLNVRSYSKEGDQLLLVKELTNTFTELNESVVHGLKVGRTQLYTYEGTPPPDVIIAVVAPNVYSFYPTYTMFFGLESTTEKIYPEPGNLTRVIETKKQYTYDPDHFQIIEEKETLTDWTGATEVKVAYKKYPQDYSFTGSPTGAEAQGIKKLQDLHIVSVPVEEYLIKQDQNSQNQISNQKVISGLLRTFKPDNPYPDQIYQLELSRPVPLSDFSPSFVSNNVLQKSFLYKPLVNYLAYDGKGNLVAQQKANDAVVTYLWGYNNTLPVAEIKNAANASTTVQFPFTNYSDVNITEYIGDTPILPSFEINSSQHISVTVGLLGSGTNLPPLPLVNLVLKRIDGTTVSGINGTWGQKTHSIFVNPGVYQWYYSTGDASFGPDLTSIYLNIANAYSSSKTGSQIFYTSFEEDGNYTAGAYTGQKAWQGSYTLYLPNQNGSYKLTYMRWNGGSPGKWEYITQDISVTSGTVQPLKIGNASSIIDEVRFYPAAAQMTTFAYKPEFGLIASADANCLVTYFDYDSFGRLKYLKDYNGNILKSYEYHYKGEY